MTTLSSRSCAGFGTYMGTPKCERPLGQLVLGISTPKGEELTYTDATDLLSQIQAKCLAGIYYPLEFNDLTTVGTKDTNFVETGYNDIIVGAEGKPDLTFRNKINDVNFNYYVRALNGANRDIILVDIYNGINAICGYFPSAGKFQAFPITLDYRKPLSVQTGSAPHMMETRLVFRDAGALTENLRIVEYRDTVLLDQIKGNKEVQLALTIGTAGAGVAYLTAICPLDGTNLAVDFPTEIVALETGGEGKALKVMASDGVTELEPVYSIGETPAGVPAVVMTFAATAANFVVNLRTPAQLAIAGIGGAPDNGFESNGSVTGSVTKT